jgi:actin-like ATPase involved in cell morphogenesis
MSGYRLGIDFGTSNTVAVVGRPRAAVRLLLFDGAPSLPSAVFADPAALLVGRDAAHAARTNPEAFEPYPKRRVDDGAVLLGDREIPVTELIGAVLDRAASEARRVMGAPPAELILTYPAAWANTRRQVLLAAAHSAGHNRVTLIPEPVAAAGYFVDVVGASVPIGGCLVIYDLGAGTFDASVVRRAPGRFDVLATEGLAEAGGLDIDAAVVAYLGEVYAERADERWRRLIAPTAVGDRRDSRLLWEDVRSGKEMLSRAASTSIHVPAVDDDVPLGRAQFEELARPILSRTVRATRRAISSAGVADRSIGGIFLVGGASRIPLVATLLHQAFGLPPTVIEQPELVVAQGGVRTLDTLAAPPTRPAPPDPRPLVSPVPVPPVSAPPLSPVPVPRPVHPGRRRRLRVGLLAAVVLGLVGLVSVVASASSMYDRARGIAASPALSHPATSAAPGRFVGTWTGDISGESTSYTMTVELASGQVDQPIGRASYPPLGCSGTWTLAQRSDAQLNLVERIDRDPRQACEKTVYVVVAADSGGGIKVSFFYDAAHQRPGGSGRLDRKR